MPTSLRSSILAMVLSAIAGTMQFSSPGEAQTPATLAPYAQIQFEPLREISGLVKSRTYSDTYWAHNDSGDSPRVFAIREDGTVRMPPPPAPNPAAPTAERPPYPGLPITSASHYDWEDIAIDGDTLYVGDVGNNFNARRDLGVYVLKEPNPEVVTSSRVLTWLPIAYPDQASYPPEGLWAFDCEAIFALRGSLYFITKSRLPGSSPPGTMPLVPRSAMQTPRIPGPSAGLYRLDTQHTDRVNVLTKVDHHADLGGWVTAADVSPDGRTLAVLAQAPVQSIWLFSTDPGGDRFFETPARRLIVNGIRTAEALAFRDDQTLILANEERDLFRVAVRDFSAVR